MLSNENEGVAAEPPKTGAVVAAALPGPLPIPPNALVGGAATAEPVEKPVNVVDLLTGAAVFVFVPVSKENNEGTGAFVAVDVAIELLPKANGVLIGGAEVAGSRVGVGSLDGVLPNENMELFGAGAAAEMGTAITGAAAAFDGPKENVATGILLGCVDNGAAPNAAVAG